MCQALGLHPARKYEKDGGPGVLRIADLLRENSSNPEEDVRTFLDAFAFNWLIAGTDVHAKNYALLLGARGAVRLAPLYDLASILPYRGIDVKKAKLAMKIGGEYRLANINLRNWRRLATEVGVEEELIIDRTRAMAAGFPDLVARIRNQVEAQGLSHPTVTALAERLKARSATCQRLLKMGNMSNSHR
jgi:serine/threonine-protein kinase HipA